MPSILDDKLLAARLAGQPEFHVRLTEFLHSYRIAERPALVVQARPVQGNALLGVNVDDVGMQKRFLAGISTNNSWWQGFRSMVAVRRTFHGIASLPAREDPAWASEVHLDGHFIAGIWRFPELPLRGKGVEVVADFYADMFLDFLQLVESMVEQESEQPTYQTTWTLTNAPKLHFGSPSMSGQFGVTALPLQILNLQWPISAAQVGTPEWRQLPVRMKQAFTGAYGGMPRPTL